MNTTRIATGTAVVISILAIGTALHEAGEARHATAALNALNRKIKGSSQSSGAAAPKPAEQQKVARSSTPETGVDAPLPPSLAAVGREAKKYQDRISRWNILARHADLIAAMKLDPDKLARFKDLLVAKDEAESDARAAAAVNGLEGSPADLAVRQAVEAVRSEISTLLGDADYQRFDDLTGVEVMNQSMKELGLAGAFVDAGEGLTPDQANSLSQLFMQQQLATNDRLTQGASQADLDAQLPANRKLMLDQAAQFLSSNQLAALQAYFDNDAALGGALKAWGTGLKAMRASTEKN